MYLTDIPWKILDELLVMDYDGGWEKLGAERGCTLRERQKMLHQFNHGRSPTRDIITKWGYEDGTMCDLYHVLLKINRRDEANIIEQYLRSNNLPIREQQLNDFSTQRASAYPPPSTTTTMMTGNPASTCESLQQINPQSLPRPSERNLLQRKDNPPDVPPPPRTYDQPPPPPSHHIPPCSADQTNPFHKPLNTDKGHNRNDLVNLNEVTNIKEIDRLPKVDYGGGHNQNCSINVNKETKDHKDMECCVVPKVFLEDGATADKPVAQNKNISSLMPFLEVGCLYTYKEMSCATDGFSDENILGAGAFGCVYRGKLKETDCAIKKLTKDFSEVNDAISNLKTNTLDELMIQLKFRHPNVVNLYGYSLDPEETCFVYEYMENGSLEDCLACARNTAPLNWCERLNIARGAACGLQYLHTQNIPVIHGDVKSSNILIDKHKEAKIGDFGLAMFTTKGTDTGILSHVSNNMTGSLFGTVAYMPPEFPRSSGRQYLAGDVYSFGVVLHEILTGQKAYDERRKPKRFLMDYIDIMLESEDENLNQCEEGEGISCDVLDRLKNIIDPNAGLCFENTIVDLYLLANKCTRSKKKDRPMMLTVFEILKRIHEEFTEVMEQIEPSKGGNSLLPYQLQQIYDRRNQRSPISPPVESVEETTAAALFCRRDSVAENKLKANVESRTNDESSGSDFGLDPNNSDESMPLSESVRKKYEGKSLPPSMDSFFSTYQTLSTSEGGEQTENGN